MKHVTDEEMLLAADGELAGRREAEVRRHLAECWECRVRMAEMEGAIGDFVRAHHAELDGRIPEIDGPRRMLAARLAEAAREGEVRRGFGSWRLGWAFVLVVGIVGGIGLGRWMEMRGVGGVRDAALPDASLPDPRLTPGRYHAVRLEDVCGVGPYEQARVESPEMKAAVLREYGMPSGAARDHEIDYLVIPELGGDEDIHNLWPEPYGATVWNARVKDELEERLHSMVCAQTIDLETAQREIATDWIAAYKKYFHTDRPTS
jgi:hypothetical protein